MEVPDEKLKNQRIGAQGYYPPKDDFSVSVLEVFTLYNIL